MTIAHNCPCELSAISGFCVSQCLKVCYMVEESSLTSAPLTAATYTLGLSGLLWLHSALHIDIHKAILGLLPHYFCDYISRTQSTYSLRSNDLYLLNVPVFRSELGRHSFIYSAPATWNSLNPLELNGTHHPWNFQKMYERFWSSYISHLYMF